MTEHRLHQPIGERTSALMRIHSMGGVQQAEPRTLTRASVSLPSIASRRGRAHGGTHRRSARGADRAEPSDVAEPAGPVTSSRSHRWGARAVAEACSRGDVEALSVVLAQAQAKAEPGDSGEGVPLVHHADRNGRRPLHVAAAGKGAGQGAGAAAAAANGGERRRADGHAACACLLIEAGAAVDATDATGRTALHLAARSGQHGVAAALIEAGGRADALDSEGWTPLALAMKRNHGRGDAAMVQLLQQPSSTSPG